APDDEGRVPAAGGARGSALARVAGAARLRPPAGARSFRRGRDALVAARVDDLPAQRAGEDLARTLARALAGEEAGADAALLRGLLAPPGDARRLRRPLDAGARLRDHRRPLRGHLRAAVRRRHEGHSPVRRYRRRRARRRSSRLEVAVSHPAHPDLPRPLQGPPRTRLSDGGVAARLRGRRLVRRRSGGEPSEAVLPSRRAHRFHPQHRGRGARLRRRRDGGAALRLRLLARDPRRVRLVGCLRLLAGVPTDAAARRRGPGQRRHGSGAPPHQGNGAAVPLLRHVLGHRLLHCGRDPPLRQRWARRVPPPRRGSAPMRLLVAGGGTGGHLFPGLALGEEVKTRHPRNDVLFVGSAKGIEAREVPKAGYPLELIDVGPLKRMGPKGFLRGLFRIPIALWQSRRVLKKFDPDVVVGVGGYASGPVVLAAWMMRIPTGVQEQNALPGFTNKFLGRIADAVFISFEEARKSFPWAKTHLLGNPIRRAFLDNYLHTKSPEERLSLFVTGGSQGAHVLNLRVIEAIELLAPQIGKRLRILHQTGVKDRDEISARYEKLRATGLEAE